MFNDEQKVTPSQGGGAHLGPSLDAILDHQILSHRDRNVHHVVAIGSLAHAWLTIAANGQAKILVFC